MKTIIKISIGYVFLLLGFSSCSKGDLPILEITDYTSVIDENPSPDQFIGTIPSNIPSNR